MQLNPYETYIEYRCPKCGSLDIYARGDMQWDFELQSWISCDVLEGQLDCMSCDHMFDPDKGERVVHEPTKVEAGNY